MPGFFAIGDEHVRRLAKDKLGKEKAQEWLWTPNPALEDNSTPEGLLQSGCPSCINTVLELVEGMS